MLVIRAAQIAAFERKLDEQFIRDHVHNIRKIGNTCTENISDHDLFVQLHAALTLARQYRIETDRDLLAYLKLSVLVSPRFDLYPLSQEILRSPDIADCDRVEVMLQRMTEADWLAASEYAPLFGE